MRVRPRWSPAATAEPARSPLSSVTSITDPEINAFLAVGTRTGKLAYVGMDGRPLVTPVWFIVEDGCIVFNTFHKSAKARALARDPRVTLCTDLEEPHTPSCRCKVKPSCRRILANSSASRQ